MAYKVVIDFSPVYELVTSLYQYVNYKEHKSNYPEKHWRKTVQSSLTPSFAAELEDERLEVLHRINLLVWQCPGERTSVSFLQWLASQPAGELYERLAPWVDSLPGNLHEIRDRMVKLLSEWNDQYFQHLEPNIFKRMEDDAAAKRDLAENLTPVDLVEEATNGLRLEPIDGLNTVFLIPQYHCYPASIVDYFDNTCTCLYPFDPSKEHEAQPSWELMNLAQAVADENRLRILRFLDGKPRTFTEIHQFSGLAKSTTNHHISALRRAGLIRSHYFGGVAHHYSLREKTVDRLHQLLAGFIKTATKINSP